MSYEISKELFEAVYNDVKVEEYYGVFDTEIQAQLKHSDYTFACSIDNFFFRCIDFVNNAGYVFVQESRGISTIQKISTRETKVWEDKTYNKQRLFDACQWILDNKGKE